MGNPCRLWSTWVRYHLTKLRSCSTPMGPPNHQGCRTPCPRRVTVPLLQVFFLAQVLPCLCMVQTLDPALPEKASAFTSTDICRDCTSVYSCLARGKRGRVMCTELDYVHSSTWLLLMSEKSRGNVLPVHKGMRRLSILKYKNRLRPH